MAVIGSAHLRLFVAFLYAVSAAKIDSNTRTLLRSTRSVTESEENSILCSQTTLLELCENQILHANGILHRFDKPTQLLLTEYYAKSTPNCKLTVCFATLQAIAYEGERYFPSTYTINGTELVQSLNKNCTTTATSLTEGNGKTFTTTTTSTTVINADAGKNTSNNTIPPVPPKSNTSYEASYELDILANRKNVTIDVPTKTKKPSRVENSDGESLVLSSTTTTTTTTTIATIVPQKIENDDEDIGSSLVSKGKQTKVIDVSTTYASGENKTLAVNNTEDANAPKKGTLFYIAGGDNSHLIKEEKNATKVETGSFEISQVVHKRNLTEVDDDKKSNLTTVNEIHSDSGIQNATKSKGYLNYEAGMDNSHLYTTTMQPPQEVIVPSPIRPSANGTNLQESSEQSEQVTTEAEKHLESIINEQESSNNTNNTIQTVEQLCEQKDQNLSLLSKIVSKLQSNATVKPKIVKKKTKISYVASGGIEFKNETKYDGVEWHNMVGVLPNKTMKILANSKLDTEQLFTEYLSTYGTLYPVPDCNATVKLADIKDIRNIFPRLDAPTTLSKRTSLSVYTTFQEAINSLYESSYNLTFDGEIETVRNINLLEHNLAILLATSQRSMSDKEFQFFITYLQVLRFADVELCKSQLNGTQVQQDTEEETADLVLHHNVVELRKVVNLTDYLSATLNHENVPENLWDELASVYEFILVDVKNNLLNNFYPTSIKKNVFMRDLFEYLLKESTKIDESHKIRLRKFISYIPT